MLREQRVLIFLYTLVIASAPSACAGDLRSARIGADGKVHIVDGRGKHVAFARPGTPYDLQLSPDRKNAVWLVRQRIDPGTGQLLIYRDGRLRTLTCLPFIRNYWFHRQGKYVAIDYGGRHFAGTEYLYDIRTLRLVDNFEQAEVPIEQRPSWSTGHD